MREQLPGSRDVVIEDGEITVVGAGHVYIDKYSPLQATERTLVAADLDSLAAAVRDPDRYGAEIPAAIYIAVADENDDFDPYLCETDEVHIVVDEQRISGSFEIVVAAGRRLTNSGYHALLRAPLAALDCRLDQLDFRFWDGSPEDEVLGSSDIDRDPDVVTEELDDGRYLRVHVVGDTIAQLIAGARLARALLVATSDGPLEAETAAHLVRSGMVAAVVGLPESEWLEVKGTGYQLSAPKPAGIRHKLELAQDVARFANGDAAAVLLVGYATRCSAPDREIVDEPKPVKVVEANAEQHRKVIDDRVYPRIEGLRIDQVRVDHDRAVLVIEIPSQPEHLKPFLVHGTTVDGRVDGSFISIVRRRGSHSVVVDPSQLHAMLVTARALSRGRGHAGE